MMLGTDFIPQMRWSGAFASAWGADAVDVMVDVREVLHPVCRFVLWAVAGLGRTKDVILKILGMLSCAGGTNRVFEYFGPGAATLSYR